MDFVRNVGEGAGLFFVLRKVSILVLVDFVRNVSLWLWGVGFGLTFQSLF